jgi:hypothetical protein
MRRELKSLKSPCPRASSIDRTPIPIDSARCNELLSERAYSGFVPIFRFVGDNMINKSSNVTGGSGCILLETLETPVPPKPSMDTAPIGSQSLLDLRDRDLMNTMS